MGEYKCNNLSLWNFLESANALLKQFANVIIMHAPQGSDEIANDLAQQASNFKQDIFEINQVEIGEN